MIKRFVFIVVSFFLLNASAVAQTKAVVMTYNIRLNVKSDGENWWENRKDKVAALMNYYEADFIGAQEVQHEQLEYLLKTLPHYSSIGVGRDDGKTAGEYSCILYNNQKYKLIQQSTFWLSQTPEKVSMGWNAVCNRVCTYGLFEHIKTKKKVWVFNTHFDHIGDTARFESARLIIERVKQLTTQQNYPVIFTGDFNSQPTDAPVQYISQHLINSRTISEMPPYGPAATWNAFKFNEVPKGWIDHVFVSKTITVQKYAVITDSYDKKYPSDHFPVLVNLTY
jgi:endonuclease/exonuclease/phosphatase family metal-dependent hydrolase